MVASPKFAWPDGKRAAVSLSFDDARLSQLDRGMPVLDRFGVKATFYVSFQRFHQRLEEWKRAAAVGHEIGNHSLNHACSANFPWNAARVLENYDLDTMEAEILEASAHIREAVGHDPVTFAYPCGQMFVGRGEACRSYVPLIARHFVAGRGWRDEHFNDPRVCDLAKAAGTESDGLGFTELRAAVAKAAAQGGDWVIFAGHEVGTGGRQTTLADDLARLCEYCLDPANGVWIDTVATVARHIAHTREAA